MSLPRSMTSGIALAILVGALTAASAAAQSSASYKVQDGTINNGGDPRNIPALSSGHFHMSLDAIGDGAVRSGLAGASFHLDTGFVARHPPRPEVTGLILTPLGFPETQLQWNPLPSAISYEVYRGTISTLPGTYGSCFAGGLASTSTTDTALPSVGQGFFYMVTARNAFGEEGPKGFRSNGLEQANPLPCP